jgi:hypothetical protein
MHSVGSSAVTKTLRDEPVGVLHGSPFTRRRAARVMERVDKVEPVGDQAKDETIVAGVKVGGRQRSSKEAIIIKVNTTNS